jgi:hypothetical protein
MQSDAKASVWNRSRSYCKTFVTPHDTPALTLVATVVK